MLTSSAAGRFYRWSIDSNILQLYWLLYIKMHIPACYFETSYTDLILTEWNVENVYLGLLETKLSLFSCNEVYLNMSDQRFFPKGLPNPNILRATIDLINKNYSTMVSTILFIKISIYVICINRLMNYLILHKYY